MTARVLIVDRDDIMLASTQRQLSAVAETVLASRGDEALGRLDEKERGPFAVLITDLSLPDMSGGELLVAFRQRVPVTTRIILTASEEIPNILDAANRGGVFRILQKGLKPADLVAAVRDGIVEHQRELLRRTALEQTFDGIVELLTGEITSTEPEFAPAVRLLRERVGQLAQVLRLPFVQELEIAAALMRLGMASVPKHVRDKLYAHDHLAPAEAARLARMPESVAQTIDHIPRLAGVAEIIRFDAREEAAPGGRKSTLRREDASLAAKILRAAVDLQILEETGLTTAAALLRLRHDGARYDRHVLKAIEALYADPNRPLDAELEECMVEDLISGMVVATDVLSNEGVSLVTAGSTLTTGLIDHLRNFAELGEVVQPLHIYRHSRVPAAE